MLKRFIKSIFVYVLIFLSYMSYSCDSSTNPSEIVVMTKISGDGQTGLAGETLSEPFVVLLHDGAGIILKDKRVDFSIIEGSGSLSETLVFTNNEGKAETTLTLGEQREVNVQAKAFGSEEKAIFIAKTKIVANTIEFVDANNQEGNPGEELVIMVIVNDNGVEPVEGVLVTFSIIEGVGSLSALQATTNAFGIAQTSLSLSFLTGVTKILATFQGADSLFSATSEVHTIEPPSVNKELIVGTWTLQSLKTILDDGSIIGEILSFDRTFVFNVDLTFNIENESGLEIEQLEGQWTTTSSNMQLIYIINESISEIEEYEYTVTESILQLTLISDTGSDGSLLFTYSKI